MPHNDFSRAQTDDIIKFRDNVQAAYNSNPTSPNASDWLHYISDANAELARRNAAVDAGRAPGGKGLGGGGLELGVVQPIPTQYQGIKTFTRLGPDDLGELKTIVYEGLFTNGVGTLTSMHTSSTATTAQKRYFINVYNEVTTSSTTKVQFSLAFGNRFGSGSIRTSDDKPSEATFKKFSNLLLNQSATSFTFNSASTTTTSDTIVAMSIKRTNLKDKIDVGNWQVTLTSASIVLNLVDDSGAISEQTNAVGRRYYNIVSGTLVTGQTNPTLFATTTYFGRVYPELGLLLFNVNQLTGSEGFSAWAPTMDFATTTNNTETFKNWISASGTISFRSQENLYSRYYFCRAKSKEYNFSQNKSYVSSSGTGEVISNVTDRGVPFSYITSVGLYNDSGELLAVSKTSQPIFKEPGVEANFKVRLDF